ncbi:hypothetical protein [Oceanobacter mangrovi]|uniref:LpxL/LpxP family acyltransferase n=1 Tax=Oceanobacter mangrovi TaxID=2862510 RepID=UPI001C8ED053|nr:hypothetical protein [Oceanobacter mangrovi]
MADRAPTQHKQTGHDGNSHWSEVDEKGSSLGLSLLLLVYKYLGRPVFTVIILFVITYFYCFAGEQRRAAQQFQQQVARVRQQRQQALWKPQPLRQFLNFGLSALDKISAWTGDITQHDIHFSQFDEMKAAVDSGRGGVILISHHGNMEILRAIGKHLPNLRINAVVHTRNAARFNELLQKVAPDSGLNLFEVTSFGPDTAIRMLDKIAAGEFIVIVADRTSVQHRDRSISARFLERDAWLPEGPFVLASILKSPVYFMSCLRTGKQAGRPQFEADFRLYTNKLVLNRKDRQMSIGQAAQDYADWLEQLVLRYPDQWFNFFDFWRQPTAVANKQSPPSDHS